MGLPCNKFTDLKCRRCSKFGKFHRSWGLLDHVDRKLDVESDGDGSGHRWGFLVTNLLTYNVAGAVNLGSSTVLGEWGVLDHVDRKFDVESDGDGLDTSGASL